MFPWILALLLAFACFVSAAALLWLVKRRHKEMSLGLQALAAMHWREFSELVKRALREQRGLRELRPDPDDALEPRSDFPLGNDDGHWLVSCKHGLAYRIGTAAINELGATARLAGARGGILITEGRVDNEALVAAEKQSVDVLDGKRLWPLLSPYLPGDIEARVIGAARHEALRRIAIAALASVTVGLLAGIGLQTLHVTPPSPRGHATTRAAAPHAPAPASPAAMPAPEPQGAAADPAEPTAPPQDGALQGIDPDEATLDHYQHQLSQALRTVPGVAGGIWQTRQTLVVNRTEEIDVVWPKICAEVMRYPLLRTVRVQINPRSGVDEPVRWRQCTTL